MPDQGSKKGPSIPDWQQKPLPDSTPTSNTAQPSSDETSTTPTSELPLLDQARIFLQEESIQNSSRERKVAFLETKGLNVDEIEQLLGAEQSTSDSSSELKTIHDTTGAPRQKEQETETASPPSPGDMRQQTTSIAPKREIPPIITYPEFLLKPQKPPPLVTLDRLATAAYIFAGISALTYGASKFIVQPMLESLTEARHELADVAREDLEKLNTKLESTVSHVPYFASSSGIVIQGKKDQEDNDDSESIDSDPTELFHRDMATQTSPGRSRSSSLSSSTRELSAQDPTATQSSRLRSLHSTLSSLLTSTETHFSQDRLQEQVGGLQGVLDKMEASFNPFQVDYGSTFASFGGAAVEDKDKGKPKKPAADNEATKFKAEIRALKGAFLSSRNFPTARAAAPFTPAAR